MRTRLIEIIGWYGAIALLGAYTLVSFSLVKSDSLSYQLLNLTGAIGIAWVSIYKKAFQPGVLNIIWAIIALIAIIKLVFSI